MAETCYAMVTGVTNADGSFTPSTCKDEASTAAMVDTEFTQMLSGMKDNAASSGVWYGSYCGDKAGEVQVKADATNDWACAKFYMDVLNSFDCDNDWVCTEGDKVEDVEACESVTAMMTATCTLTADEIKTKVDKRRTDGYCKNKADGGEEFAPPVASANPHASGLKCLLGKNGVDPVSTAVDADCCNSAGLSGTPVCVRFCNKDKKVTYEGVDKNVADLFVDDPTGETWGATATLVCDTDNCNIKIDKPCDYVPVAVPSSGFSTLRSGQGPALTLMVGLFVLFAGTW